MPIFIPVRCSFDYYNFVWWFDIRKCAAAGFVFSPQICFGYLRSFMVPYKWKKVVCFFFYCFYEECHWNFIKDFVGSIGGFGRHGHFNNINYYTHEQEISFHLCLLQFLLTMSYSFQCTRDCLILVYIIPHSDIFSTLLSLPFLSLWNMELEFRDVWKQLEDDPAWKKRVERV